MANFIGFDSRLFFREVTKRDGFPGRFESVIGIGVKVKDYTDFKEAYLKAISMSFSKYNLEPDYSIYCTHDLANFVHKNEIIAEFAKNIAPSIDKIHVFYTLFSRKRAASVKVYGRKSRAEKIRLSSPTMTYSRFISKHLLQCFPAICAWRLKDYFHSFDTFFHIDSYSGHTFEAQEELEESGFNLSIYPSGDCLNPIISTADLLLDLLDNRLLDQNKFLIFENIRPALFEFGEKVLVYPIINKHLPKITPLDKSTINTLKFIGHPVFWVVKQDTLINSETLKCSKAFRNLVDYASTVCGSVKLFSKSRDVDFVKKGDFGVYFDNNGLSTIESYIKLGVPLKKFNFDGLVPKEHLPNP